MIRILATVLAIAVLAGFPLQRTDAAEKHVHILAYINQASGCQRPTEALLEDLDKTYGDRVTLEFVDFGSPEGQKRWRGDGMKCMAIKLNGSSKVNIVYKGVELTVTFDMPVGCLWLHEELGTAVRQMLTGVSAADRRGPEITPRKDGEAYGVAVSGDPVLGNLAKSVADDTVKAMRKAAEEKPLTQEDFSVNTTAAGADFFLRGDRLISLEKDNITDDNEFEKAVAARFHQFIKPFPRVSRPFSGFKGPPRRR